VQSAQRGCEDHGDINVLGYVARAMRTGRAKLGEPSFLDGVDCGNAAVLHQVRLDAGLLNMSEDNYVAHVDTALIDVVYDPHVDQILVHPDGRYKLDRLIHDNGVNRQFLIVSVP
jgi:hypothetical protein